MENPDNQQGSLQLKRAYRKHGRDTTHPEFPHGIFAGWKAGCRCESCIEANRLYKRDHIRSLRLRNQNYLAKDRDFKRLYRKTVKGRAVYRNSCIRRKRHLLSGQENSLLNAIYAACPPGYEVDHIVPLSKGGRHDATNLQYLPKVVNSQKRARIDYDCGDAALDWRSLVKEPPTTIPQGSRAKRPEAQSTLVEG